MEMVEETMVSPTKDLWHVDLKTMTELVDDFKALLTTEFYPSNEIEKLECEFWNHSPVGADHAGYTGRFHELAKLVPHLVTPKAKRVTRKERDEASKSESARKDEKKAKWGRGFVAALALEGNRNTQDNENRSRGRAFNMNVVDALQDSNIVT
nr:reverse transcriptase domain-containing protein [Tanacetum cinerariifolium]